MDSSKRPKKLASAPALILKCALISTQPLIYKSPLAFSFTSSAIGSLSCLGTGASVAGSVPIGVRPLDVIKGEGISVSLLVRRIWETDLVINVGYGVGSNVGLGCTMVAMYVGCTTVGLSVGLSVAVGYITVGLSVGMIVGMIVGIIVGKTVVPTEPPAFKVKVASALASRLRKTVASTIPPNAEMPRSIRGSRCASTVALEVREGLTESLSSKHRSGHDSIVHLLMLTVGTGVESTSRRQTRLGPEKLGVRQSIGDVNSEIDINIKRCLRLSLDLKAGTNGNNPRGAYERRLGPRD